MRGSAPRYVTGWFSSYHRRRKLIHPVMVQHIQPQALRLAAPPASWQCPPPELHVLWGYRL